MSSISPTNATRDSGGPKTKLRASCDGCYLTKVKCNKSRPMCSRCLTYGVDCVYSPSSRSGRTKRGPESGKTRDCYESGPSSRTPDEVYGEAHQSSRPPFWYIPPASFSGIESSYDNTTILTPELGQSFGQYSVDDSHRAGPERDLLVASSEMEPVGPSFWAQSAETPTTKFPYTFPEDDLLPLTSELTFTSLNMSWNQFPDSQLNFTSYDPPTAHFTPCHSPTTSVGVFPLKDCSCSTTSHQHPQVLRNHFCPSFRQSH